jgi:hypothetical protein
MASGNRMNKLNELDRLVNDPNVLLDAARVWDLLDELAGGDAALTLQSNQVPTANPASLA